MAKLITQGHNWVQFSTSRHALFSLVIHLLTSVTENADQLFFLLLNYASHEDSAVSVISEEILGMYILTTTVLSLHIPSWISNLILFVYHFRAFYQRVGCIVSQFF